MGNEKIRFGVASYQMVAGYFVAGRFSARLSSADTASASIQDKASPQGSFWPVSENAKIGLGISSYSAAQTVIVKLI